MAFFCLLGLEFDSASTLVSEEEAVVSSTPTKIGLDEEECLGGGGGGNPIDFLELEVGTTATLEEEEEEDCMFFRGDL